MGENWFKYLFNREGFVILKELSYFYLFELKKFYFSAFNPYLWIFFVLAWVILAVRWNYKKSFSYCLLVTLVLLATTQVEKYIAHATGIPTPVEFTVSRLICGLFIIFISIYYFFIKTE